MNIGLNAISFVPGTFGGLETYFRNLIFRLQSLDRDNSYTVLCDERFAGEFALFNDSFRVESVNYAKPSFNWFLRGVLRNTLNIDILARRMNALDVDIIHHPFTVLTPPEIKIPSVLTFWDMQQEFFPEFFSKMELARRKRLYRPSAEAATRIIVSARFTKDCLVERYGIEADKIEVIYTGYGPEYLVFDDAGRLAEVRRKYALDKPFLFYPAATWPHKNHKALLAALKIMIDRYAFDGELVLTGIAMQSHGDLLAEINRLGLGGVVKVLGYLPVGELPCLYNLARMLVFPSLFEGFGIPLVEAMACGCPVVCSNVTSLPEVVGDAGEMFDPRVPERIAETAWSVWSDEGKRREMRERGLARALLFNWEETARKTIEVYRKVGSGKA